MADPLDRLARFTARMQAELDTNAVKGDWTDLPFETSLYELRHHVWKLEKAAREGNREALAEYAADVANCALFVASSAGCLNNNEPVYRKPSLSARVKEFFGYNPDSYGHNDGGY